MSEDRTYEMSCIFITETDNAVLIEDPVTGDEHWIPLSQVDRMDKDKNKHGTIVMTEWIAKKKGLC
ncbi:MAG: hypothetical protein KGL39_60035 [Patescibacteria group bacterium]|nr:hypothetical protein [Patescibacteria group bacterium]